ncbi:hypothetical protein ABTC31_20475, partial [Acinetobacter baumannii]
KLPPPFDARLVKVADKTVKTSGFDAEAKKNELHIKTEEQARALVAEAERERFIVADVSTKERRRNPVPPFTTSKLQQ